MVIPSFSMARLPAIEFGAGRLDRVPELARRFGVRSLLVTGRRSFVESARWPALLADLEARGLNWEHLTVEGEPSPALVDGAVARFRPSAIDVVIAVGGGSAIDAAKAIAGMLPHGNSVMDHLEGVGRNLPYEGPSVPLIAVPTTAGTGSEATKNAVLSDRCEGGFKKSFRHGCLVPLVAVVDPELLASCPPELIAANGMDAVTQLIESYVSPRSGPVTEALAWSGLEAARDALWTWHGGGADEAEGRRGMAYAALMSGITLAQTGLGAVHGLASPLGARFPVPHGVVCGTLLAPATEVNLAAIEERDPSNPARRKYHKIAALLGAGEGRQALPRLLADWTARLDIPRLDAYGIGERDLPAIVAESRGSSMKTNPVKLFDDEIERILRERL